jgi:hypothetical protein
MKLTKYVFFLAAALLIGPTMLFSNVPAFAVTDSAAASSAPVTLADTLPGMQAPAPPGGANGSPSTTGTQPAANPAPAPQQPVTYDNSYPPHPRPPRPIPPYPQPTPPQPVWPYDRYYPWQDNYYPVNPNYNNPVIIYQQAQPVSYVPVVSSFTADPNYVQPGQAATLTWTVSNADTITISPSVGSVAATGSVAVIPATTTTYTLTATSTQGTVSASTTVTVAPYITSSYGTTNNTGTVAIAASTDNSGGTAGTAGTADINTIITSGISSLGTSSVNPWMMYMVLLGLLALAAFVIVLLMVRKPAAAHAHSQGGSSTGYLATAAAPAATLPATSIPATTAVNPGLAAKFVLPGGTAMPVSGKPLGRRDFQELIPAEKAGLVSRQHLQVTYENNGYHIEDLNSTNGTRLNGSEIRGSGRHTIASGDTVELAGALKLTFRE